MVGIRTGCESGHVPRVEYAMWRLWSGLSVVFPFQQFGKRRLNTSTLSSGQATTTANFLLAPPPQLQETMPFGCGRFALAFPATIFRPGGIVATEPFVWRV